MNSEVAELRFRLVYRLIPHTDRDWGGTPLNCSKNRLLIRDPVPVRKTKFIKVITEGLDP